MWEAFQGQSHTHYKTGLDWKGLTTASSTDGGRAGRVSPQYPAQKEEGAARGRKAVQLHPPGQG